MVIISQAVYRPGHYLGGWSDFEPDFRLFYSMKLLFPGLFYSISDQPLGDKMPNFCPRMQIFALTPHFWSSLHVHNSDTLLDCLPQAEVDKNHSPGPPNYILFQKKFSCGAGCTLFSTDPRHFQPVLLYKWPEVGVIFGY
jgi:hypothetical protein